MKRTLAAACAAMLLAGTLTACGTKDNNSTAGNNGAGTSGTGTSAGSSGSGTSAGASGTGTSTGTSGTGPSTGTSGTGTSTGTAGTGAVAGDNGNRNARNGSAAGTAYTAPGQVRRYVEDRDYLSYDDVYGPGTGLEDGRYYADANGVVNPNGNGPEQDGRSLGRDWRRGAANVVRGTGQAIENTGEAVQDMAGGKK